MRILLVEDHPATRAEMRALLSREIDMTVVAEAEIGEEAVAQARQGKPDVIVMDIMLLGMNGIEATRQIRAQQSDARVLVLSNHFSESLVRSVFEAGALGYVRKHRAFEELVAALRTVAANQRYGG